MKKTLLASLLACFFAAGVMLAADAEDAAIIEVVDRAYVQGVHIDGDPEKIRNGFHESFVMFIQNEGRVSQLTRDGWIARIEAATASADRPPRPETRGESEVLDRPGNAAVARGKLFRGEKQIVTDYISLYRFDDGWKLVGKTFHRH